jgi:serine/threonine protein kinase
MCTQSSNRIAQGLNLFQNNILISDYHEAQITDFGLARILDVQGFTTMTLRNVRYAAPELRPNGDVDMRTVRPTTQSDIFSLGILFLQVRPYTLSEQAK